MGEIEQFEPAFQFDESCSAKHLIRWCKAEGRCEIRSFPDAKKGKKDWEWFGDLLSAGAPIVSTDFTIAFDEQNVRAIPQNPSGIIVVKPKHPTTGFGSRQAEPILAAFKKLFPDWAMTDWSEVYVEITELDVTVRNLLRASKTDGVLIPLSEANLGELLIAAIAVARGGGAALIEAANSKI